MKHRLLLSSDRLSVESKRQRLQQLTAQSKQAEQDAQKALSAFVSSPFGLSAIAGAGFLNGMTKTKKNSALMWLTTVSKYLL